MKSVLNGQVREKAAGDKNISPSPWEGRVRRGGRGEGNESGGQPKLKKTANERKQRAQRLRASQTKSEDLLWSILRAKQICGLKSRRQHPIGPFVADFACVNKKLVIEIDGCYHDQTAKSDFERESYIRIKGWELLRFNDEEVEVDAEVVARGIAKHLDLQYQFEKRKGSGSGMLATKPSPQSRKRDCDPPKGRVM